VVREKEDEITPFLMKKGGFEICSNGGKGEKKGIENAEKRVILRTKRAVLGRF